MNDEMIEAVTQRVANGELLQFTAEERAALVKMKVGQGLTSAQAEQAVKNQEESDRARGLVDSKAEAEAEAEPEAVPASKKKK